MIQLKKETLKKIKLILAAQHTTFSKPEMIKRIPWKDRPMMALQRKILKNILKEIDDALK